MTTSCVLDRQVTWPEGGPPVMKGGGGVSGGPSGIGGGMHWKGVAPLQAPQPMPSHCLLDAKCQPQWHL